MSRTKLSLSDATEIVMGRKVRVELRDGRTGIGRVHIRTRGLVPGTLEGFGVTDSKGSKFYTGSGQHAIAAAYSV